MTELAIREDRAAELAVAQRADAAIARLAEWAHSAQAAHEVATRLVQTSFVPEGFRGKPGEATAAILAGAEVGLNPMAALRSFDVIQGTAAPRANTLRAIVQSMGHEIRLVESTETRAVVEGRRRGESSWQKSVWTIERAQKLGLTNKANWRNQPQAMLVARATAECARLVASDAILGIGYSAEELFDAAAPDVAEKPAKATKKRTMQRAPLAEPEFDDQPEAAAEPQQPRQAGDITDAQMKLMQKLFADAGITDRAEKLAYATKAIGRDIQSATELTKTEAATVIAELTKVEEAVEVEAEPEFDGADWPATAEPPAGDAA